MHHSGMEGILVIKATAMPSPLFYSTRSESNDKAVPRLAPPGAAARHNLDLPNRGYLETARSFSCINFCEFNGQHFSLVKIEEKPRVLQSKWTLSSPPPFHQFEVSCRLIDGLAVRPRHSHF